MNKDKLKSSIVGTFVLLIIGFLMYKYNFQNFEGWPILFVIIISYNLGIFIK